MAHNLVVLEWLYKADQDFGFASLVLTEEKFPYYDQICFCFQQAAEKYFKAYIIKFDLLFKKEHDLKKLCSTCSAHNPSFHSLVDACIFLNPFYMETRYADDRFVIATKEQTHTAQQMARMIQEAVRKGLSVSGEVTADMVKKENRKIDEALKRES